MDSTVRDSWQEEMKLCRGYMEKRHKVWKECLEQYRMEFRGIPGVKGPVVRLSRIYPIVRQIVASIAFNNPYVYVSIRPNQELVPDREMAAGKLERAANEILRICDFRPEAQQMIVDALFCTIAWCKIGFRSGENDVLPSMLPNTPDAVDFATLYRCNPWRIHVDDTPGMPQKLGYARFIFEDILLPKSVLLKSPKFGPYVEDIQSLGDRDVDSMLRDWEMGGGSGSGGDDLKKAMLSAKYIRVTEVHDRLERKLITFISGKEDPVFEQDHPFRAMSPVYETSPVDGSQVLTGFDAAPGYIMEDGFPFVDLRFDMEVDTYYPQPPIAYIQDLEKLVVESITRRRELLQRYKRILFGDATAKSDNEGLEDKIHGAGDGDIVWLNGSKDAFWEPEWGNVPNDQLGLETDARTYEQNSLHVQDFSQSGGGSKSATEVAVTAGQGSLNREWMQDKISRMYNRTIRNTLRMFRDPRYTPEQFIINLGKGDQTMQYVLTSQDFAVDFDLDIDVASMQPLTFQLDRDSTVLMYDRLVASPNINRLELDKDLIKAFRHRVPERLLNTATGSVDAQKLAQVEVMYFLMQGKDPGVQPGENHQAHMAVQSPEALQKVPQFATLPPQIQQTVLQAAQAHTQAHQQQMQAELSGSQSGSMPAQDGRLQTGQKDLTEMVRSASQTFANAAIANNGQLTSQGV